MSSGGQPVAVPPPVAAPDAGDAGGWRKHALAAGFLAPAAVFLGIWIVYPTIRTIIRSFYDRSGDSFVWFDNYREIFTNDLLLTSVKNNAIWVLVVPALVTAIGLVFAVLTEKVGWAVAFKTAVFMPMAISAFAAGITWRIMLIQEPDRGALNAVIAGAHDAFKGSAGVLSDAAPSSDALTGTPKGGLMLQKTIRPGQTALLGLTRIGTSEVPEGAEQAAVAAASSTQITGVVWRDFKPGGGTPGKVEAEELGLPGVTVQLRDAEGKQLEKTTSGDDGGFTFDDVQPGDYRVGIGAETFAQSFGGVTWLGPKLITPAIIIAYIWIWAGFAMVVIAAGLSSMPRDVLEAARTDGGTEWQVFRRVTVPLLAPVLTVVFVTMLINVLKIFDIIISIAPGSVQDDASVLALGMWRTAFGGANDFGVGSAVAVFIFLLVIPILLFNIRSFPEGDVSAIAASPEVVEEGASAKVLRVLGKAPVHFVLLAVGLLWLVPTLGLFVTSLLAPEDFQDHGWWQVFTKPSKLTFENYDAVFSNQQIRDSLITTAIVAIGGTVLPILVAACAGYAFAWLEYPGRDWWFIGVIALLVVPLQMSLIPMFQLYNKLGIFDTKLSLILFHTAFGLPFAIFLLRNFFIGIPKDILESARIDGASEVKIFLRLILPLGLPAIASLAIFQFLWTWNDLLVALTFGRSTQPITVAIFSQLRQFGANIELIAPATFVSLAVPLVVFFAFQRYFVQGLLAGSVK